MTAPVWTVEHHEHEYVPDGAHSSTLEADGSLIQTVKPENLHFVLQLGVLGPGQIDYEISIDAVDDEGDPVVTADFVGPYRTDFHLKRSGLTHPLMAGMHTQVGGQDGEDPIDAVRIGGQDWLHYLEKRVWPYDATKSAVLWPTGFLWDFNDEVGQQIKDILETIRDVSANWPDPPDVLSPNPSYSLGFTVDADDTGVSRRITIPKFDATSIYSLIQTYAQARQGYGGFDFLMSWDKVFRLVVPEIGDPDAPVFTLEVDATTHLANMVSAGFTNTGPEATHVLGVGAGTANKQGGINKHFPASSAVFRRLDKVADFGDVTDLAALEAMTALELAFGSNPVHEIPIEVNPADITGFWDPDTGARPGRYVAVDYDLGFHRINSTQRIVSMDCSVDTEGEERVVLAFNQFYDATDNGGIADF